MVWLFALALGASCKDEVGVVDTAGAEGAAVAVEATGAQAVAYASLPRAEDPSDQAQWVLKPKMTVGEIVKSRYGNRHYVRTVILHNKIHDASRLPVGKRIETPALETVLLEEPGLRRRAGDEAKALADARHVFMAFEADFQSEAEAAADPMQVKLSAAIAAKARALAGELETLGEALTQERPETRKAPTMAAGSLLEAAAILQRAADGEVQDEKLDADLVHQRLGNAMADMLIWARVERR